MTVNSTVPAVPRLRRTLTLWDVVFYGIVLVQPVAPMGIYGVVSQEARGHVIRFVVVILFLGAAVRYLLGTSPSEAELLRPFYDPATFSLPAVLTGASIACLTYIGFDGISTLSEEVENPRRNILLATVLTCLITGMLASMLVYSAQLVWGNWTGFPDVDTAFIHVAGKAGGTLLFALVSLTLLVANLGSGTGAHLGAARLLYGMGRSNALPSGFFGGIDPRNNIPRNNVLLVGALAFVGGLSLSYQLGAEMLNFGAFIAFMGVNLAAFTPTGCAATSGAS